MTARNPGSSRWIGEMPKIGIRPTIDGRRGGVREALEDQTMEMAKSVAKLISSNVRYPDGQMVECIIADRCIGGAAEAAMAADKFVKAGVGVSLTVTRCWCYGSETMDMDPLLPKAVWGFNGTERPGAVYLAAVLAGYNQKGLPAFGIYGRDVQDAGDRKIPDDVKTKILRFVRAGLAVSIMRGKSYLSMGGVSMGIAGSIVDQSLFSDYLGMRVETIDSTEFVRRMDRGIYDASEYDRAHKWVKANCNEGPDLNPRKKRRSRAQLEKDWETCVKMTLIARDLMVGNPVLEKMGYGEEALGHNAIAAGFQGQRQWTDHYPNGDFLETILNTSFDWNGIRAPYIVATENDCLNGICMLFGNLLTNTSQIFADVRTYWSPAAVKRVAGHKLTGKADGGILHLINSGPAALEGTGQHTAGGKPVIKPFWELTQAEIKRCLRSTRWHPASLEYFPGGGFSVSYATRGGMPVTMSRVNMIKGLGPTLQIAEGWTIDLPRKAHVALDERTSPTWPTTWFAPRCDGRGPFRDAYTVMNNWGANHGSFSYGHVGADLITLASMLRIPVCMHNVGEQNIYRPSAWTAFGANDPQGADFRACANFGSIYG
ncbi:MAG: L-fucose isomerase [Lentisphaerales bacterium]|nr:MAG: L-fucose isomerase [Lentisphaerales bacterium]